MHGVGEAFQWEQRQCSIDYQRCKETVVALTKLISTQLCHLLLQAVMWFEFVCLHLYVYWVGYQEGVPLLQHKKKQLLNMFVEKEVRWATVKSILTLTEALFQKDRTGLFSQYDQLGQSVVKVSVEEAQLILKISIHAMCSLDLAGIQLKWSL